MNGSVYKILKIQYYNDWNIVFLISSAVMKRKMKHERLSVIMARKINQQSDRLLIGKEHCGFKQPWDGAENPRTREKKERKKKP